MTGLSEIWRQRAWLWVPALLFFLANATAYSIYRFGFADRVAGLQEDMEETQKQLAPLEQRGQHLQRLIQRAEANRRLVRQIYDDRFSTRSQRLTNITAEVERLARQAGLDPREFAFPQREVAELGLVKRSFVFSVNGTYVELRRFINLLELSPSFLTLEEVKLGGGAEGSEELQISLRLSTLFAQPPGSADLTPARRATQRGGQS